MFCHNAKLSSEQANDIRRIFKEGKANKTQLAKLYNVTTQVINSALNNPNYGLVKSGAFCGGHSTLTTIQVREIRLAYEAGVETATQLAERYNVSYTTIRNILANRVWKDPTFTPADPAEVLKRYQARQRVREKIVVRKVIRVRKKIVKQMVVKTTPVREKVKQLVVSVVVDDNGTINEPATIKAYQSLMLTLKINNLI